MEPPPGAPKDTWDRMAAHLRSLADEAGAKPRAILVVSAHWETKVPTVNAAVRHSLYYDYYNFPEHTYRLTYPAAGDPVLAARVRTLLGAAGFETAEETERGLDHGVFIPFLLIYPQADIPIVQLSLQAGLDPEAHLAMGRALAPLRDEGVLIVGSGMTYHNLPAMFSGRGDPEAKVFDDWLTAAVESPDPARRDQALAHWATAPGGRAAHPREEHLIPLMVAAGAAGEDLGQRIYGEAVMGKALSGYRFG
jgi:aromatic ring-opening dioxygenase catalytic subunit (LigB family)